MKFTVSCFIFWFVAFSAEAGVDVVSYSGIINPVAAEYISRGIIQAEKDSAGDSHRKHRGPGGDSYSQRNEQEHDIPRIANLRTKPYDRKCAEDAQPAGQIVPDGHDQHARDHAAKYQGVYKRTGVRKSLVSPPVNRRNG